MRRDVDVGASELDGDWSLVDPKVVPAFARAIHAAPPALIRLRMLA